MFGNSTAYHFRRRHQNAAVLLDELHVTASFFTELPYSASSNFNEFYWFRLALLLLQALYTPIIMHCVVQVDST